MRPLRLLLLYLAVGFVGAALLSPWIYWLAQWAGEQSSSLASLGAQPFHRYVNRCLLGLALAGLWPFLRGMGANSWPAVGLVKPAGQWHRLASGFALGFVSLAGVALLAIAGGGRVVKADFPVATLLARLLSAILTAVVVAFLEELLFRGAVFGALCKSHRWTTALAASSAMYAFVHFFEKPEEPTQVIWSSGLETLCRMCRGFIDLQMLVPGFATLLLAGVILGLAYHRTGNLYLSIGLHAGWVFWLRFYGVFTIALPEARQWFWGSEKLIDGWLGLGMLLPVLLFVWSLSSKREAAAHAA